MLVKQERGNERGRGREAVNENSNEGWGVCKCMREGKITPPNSWFKTSIKKKREAAEGNLRQLITLEKERNLL